MALRFISYYESNQFKIKHDTTDDKEKVKSLIDEFGIDHKIQWVTKDHWTTITLEHTGEWIRMLHALAAINGAI